MREPRTLSTRQAISEIRSGGLTSEALVASCLERIEERERSVRAWAYCDPDVVLHQARLFDQGAADPHVILHGIPVGVKDVLDTVDMPTGYNSAIYRDHRPAWDAACVAAARSAGGIVLGKTVTTEFANNNPAATHNPHDLGHTPGGSSSGSAAAVADFMVPLAIATQTGGSTIRPAAFCGVVGYKPSFGTINRCGLKFVAESLDTIGVISRTVDDAALFVSAVSGRPMPSFDERIDGPEIGLCRTPHWEDADPATRDLIENVASRLAKAGAKVRDVSLPSEVARMYEDHGVVMYFEAARALAYEFDHFRPMISANLSTRLMQGRAYAYEVYEAALSHAREGREAFAKLMDTCDVLLTPSARGEAPEGLGSTGDSLFNKNWTLLGVPCVTIPCGFGPAHLPLGVQFVGAYANDNTTSTVRALGLALPALRRASARGDALKRS